MKKQAHYFIVIYFEKETKKSQPTLKPKIPNFKDISYLISKLYVNAQTPGFHGSYELKFRP
jgi:hypothetical protein